MASRPAARVGMCMAVLLTAGCGHGSGSPAPAAPERSSRELRQLLLPDLSTMRPRVQERLRSAHAALEAARAANAPAPVLSHRYGELGNLFLAIDYAGTAEVAYDNALVLSPLESKWSYYMGHAHRRLGNLQKSTSSFSRSHQMDPDYVPAYVWEAEMALALGQLELARLAFAAALSWRPQLQAGLFGLGRVALEQRQYAQAADYLSQALALDGGASAIRYPLALAHRGMGNVAAAESELRQRGPVQPALHDPWMDDIERLRASLARGSSGPPR
jgi:tetratricopeptide (TPR) repeat protein